MPLNWRHQIFLMLSKLILLLAILNNFHLAASFVDKFNLDTLVCYVILPFRNCMCVRAYTMITRYSASIDWCHYEAR